MAAKKRGRPRKEPIVMKKKRGRPKGSKNKVKKLSLNVIPKKRGRPKGSKNKVKKLSLNVIPKKRGRPKKASTVSKITKKVKKKISTESKTESQKKRGRPAKKRVIEEVDLSNVTFNKHLGYCPDCHGMISDKDYEEGKKTIFVCYKCQYRGRTGTLLKDRKKQKVKSKKAFLAETIVVHNEGDDNYEPDIPNEFQAVPEDEWN